MAEFTEEQFGRWAQSDDPRVRALVAEVKRLREARIRDREHAACIAENEDSGEDAAEHIREMDLP
jgi:hypothetical protein